MTPTRPYAGTGKLHYREAWAFKGCTAELLNSILIDAPQPIVHLCSGSSILGDVRVDLVHPFAHVRADARRLPIRSQCAGTVIADPPWSAGALSLTDRQALCSEAGRILRHGGLFLLYAPWWPTPLWATDEGVWFPLEQPDALCHEHSDVRVNGKHQLPFAPVLLSQWRRRPAPEAAA